MGWGIDRAERLGILDSARKREQKYRWNAPGRAKVVHPAYGTVVVPHSSNLTAIRNAAEVWRCSWTEITDARVWAAEPGDAGAVRPHVI